MNSSNETFYPLDFWFNFYGYPYIIDLVIGYFITPAWVLSLIFSAFSLFILLKHTFFASNFFSFMRLYVVNCLILSALSLTTILPFTRRFLSFSNTYEAAVYGNYAFWFIVNSLTLYSSCIEICLVVERILYLLPGRFTRMKFLGFKTFFFFLFILSFLVNVPGIFLFEPAFGDVQLDEKTNFRVWYIGYTSFSFSLAGQIFGYIFRDILPMIFNIGLNSLSIYLVRNYVKNKQRLTAATINNSEMANFDRKQTYVALGMSTFSLLEHILIISSYVLFFINNYDLSNLLLALGLLLIAIKHALIFFVLLLFNSLFRNEVINCFKNAHLCTSSTD